MPSELSGSDLNVLLIAGLVIGAWYFYQIASRKKEQIRFEIRRAIVALLAYCCAIYSLVSYRVPSQGAAVAGVFIGFGASWLFVKAPKRGRRIPQSVRRKVIERDLTSRGMKWDPDRYDLDHVVPYSRGGDHSERNLRVTDKRKNRRKGKKMPGFFDFLRMEIFT